MAEARQAAVLYVVIRHARDHRCHAEWSFRRVGEPSGCQARVADLARTTKLLLERCGHC
jgi:hypothetical protein